MSTLPKSSTEGNNFSQKFFRLTAKEVQSTSENDPYDIVIVGTGVGGGVLAADLYESNRQLGNKGSKKILVIEKGDLIFHSHCLNTSRPATRLTDRTPSSDNFYSRFKSEYNLTEDSDMSETGGPMYCLGGRSTVWGLFAPRLHDDDLKQFPKSVRKELLETYYARAEALMNVNVPATNPDHEFLVDQLKMAYAGDAGEDLCRSRIASQFKDGRRFGFGEGTFSSVDTLLDIAMNAGETKGQQVFDFLLDAEVRSLAFNADTKAVESVSVRAERKDYTIKCKNVVLCAGSVDSPAILLRSNKTSSQDVYHITDHNIYFACSSFKYRAPIASGNHDLRNMRPITFQTYVNINESDPPVKALANVSVDAPSFIPKRSLPKSNEYLPKFIMSFILPASLQTENKITLKSDDNVEVLIKRPALPSSTAKMSDLVTKTRDTVASSLQLEFVDEPQKLTLLDLGVVGHELGSLPMPTANKPEQGCVNESLELKDHKGVFVCDSSVFPLAPAANPALTLAALALRLSHRLLPRDGIEIKSSNILVVNHTGKAIKVRVSNENGENKEKSVMLDAGASHSWERSVNEAVLVYRPIKKDDKITFSNIPDLFVGYPGSVLQIS